MVSSNKECLLIIDSCCDLPRSLVEKAELTCLHFPFNMNDGEHLDDLWASMKPKEFYDRLRNGEVSGTSQIPVPEILNVLTQAAARGIPTVYLVFSSGLSGTFETVGRVAKQVKQEYPDFEFYPIDTRLASIAEGLLVYGAYRQHQRGLSAKELAVWAKEARWFVNAIFTVSDLETLRRGGRIPDTAAMAGTKLDVRPLLSFNIDGALSLIGVARGHKKALKQMIAFFQDRHSEGMGTDNIILIGSADDEESEKWLEDHLKRPDGSLPAIHCKIGPVIGSHVGPDMIALVFWGPDRREKMSIADRIAAKLGKQGDKNND